MDKISKVSEMLPNYGIVVFNGNLLYPFNNILDIKSRIQTMNVLLETKKVIYNIGNYDLELLTILYKSGEHSDIQNWIVSKPNIVDINSSSVLVVNGGIMPSIKSIKELDDNLEISFVSKINNKPWQVYYQGWLGYIVSNNPITTNKPKFFPYASQIGTEYSENSSVYAQEIDQFGLNNIIEL